MLNDVMVSVFMIVVGFILLIKGADFFVEGSSSLAKRLEVPSMIIGLTIVAMGTSLPECAVSVTAAMEGNNTLAVSNVVGSNIFNLLIVCGLCALFSRLPVQRATLIKEFPFSVFCALLLLAMGCMGMSVGRIEGIILLLIFTAYILWMIRSAMSNRQIAAAEDDEYRILPVWRCALYIIAGMAAIKFGGDFVVDSAVVIAAELGLSDTLIGLTIVAVGTSLPELVTSVVAARKNEVEIAVGNVIGSNIFNILLVLGVAAVISPIGFIAENVTDILVVTGVSVVVWLFAWKKQSIGRVSGFLMIMIYSAYMYYICVR